jgi:hypothetical protein
LKETNSVHLNKLLRLMSIEKSPALVTALVLHQGYMIADDFNGG